MRRDCTGGYLSVQLQSDPSLFDAPQVVTARAGGVTRSISVPPTSDPQQWIVPLAKLRNGTCVVDFTTKTVRVPAEVQAGSTDTRPLGVHFVHFGYLP
jgi:hypothetical protein